MSFSANAKAAVGVRRGALESRRRATRTQWRAFSPPPKPAGRLSATFVWLMPAPRCPKPPLRPTGGGRCRHASDTRGSGHGSEGAQADCRRSQQPRLCHGARRQMGTGDGTKCPSLGSRSLKASEQEPCSPSQQTGARPPDSGLQDRYGYISQHRESHRPSNPPWP